MESIAISTDLYWMQILHCRIRVHFSAPTADLQAVTQEFERAKHRPDCAALL